MIYETICKYCGHAFTFVGIDKRKLPRSSTFTDVVECPKCGEELLEDEPGFYPWREVKDGCK